MGAATKVGSIWNNCSVQFCGVCNKANGQMTVLRHLRSSGCWSLLMTKAVNWEVHGCVAGIHQFLYWHECMRASINLLIVYNQSESEGCACWPKWKGSNKEAVVYMYISMTMSAFTLKRKHLLMCIVWLGVWYGPESNTCCMSLLSLNPVAMYTLYMHESFTIHHPGSNKFP